MVGIDFRIKNEYGSPLKNILKKVFINKYYWKIEYSEVYKHKDVDDKLDYNMFNIDIMNGKEFEEEVNMEKYYMIFLTALAFESKNDIVKINNYIDFKKSKCEIAFICTDNEYIQVFCKDKSILEQILNNCINNNFDKIEILTEEDDLSFSFV